ncbi:MAG: hypothetical protein OXT67_02595 [Zetaproteobacteria bacterium]|nr:hypothetical protein [Zetaproteobacteria bacterium]
MQVCHVLGLMLALGLLGLNGCSYVRRTWGQQPHAVWVEGYLVVTDPEQTFVLDVKRSVVQGVGWAGESEAIRRAANSLHVVRR